MSAPAAGSRSPSTTITGTIMLTRTRPARVATTETMPRTAMGMGGTSTVITATITTIAAPQHQCSRPRSV